MAECNTGSVIPTDNTPLPCPEFFGTDCVIYQEAISYLGLPPNSPLTDVIQAMLASLVDARNRIINLENA